MQIGEAGLIVIRYVGWNEIGDYLGYTGTVYRFGLLRQRGYVDKRDVPTLLEMVEDGKWVFEIWAEQSL